MRSLTLALLALASTLCAAAPVELLRDSFDGKSQGTLNAGAAFVDGLQGKAVKLQDNASVIYEGFEFPREKGRIEMDVCPHAPITPRPDRKHFMLLTDVGAGGAWKGATVVYWDRDTAKLGYGIFNGGWQWIWADGVTWDIGKWRHVAFIYGPEGRTLEIDGKAIAHDSYADGISPRTMRLGTMDGYSVSAPVLIDNLVVSAEPVDALRLSRAVICPQVKGALDTVSVNWSVASAGEAALDLRDKSGRVVAVIRPMGPVAPGMYEATFAGASAPTGAYEVRLSIRPTGAGVKVLRATLHIDRELRWQPAPNRAGEHFPLGMWYFWEDDASYINRHVDDANAARAYYEKTVADLAGLGIDLIMGDWTPRDHRKMLLDAAQRHNMRVIVHLDEVNGFLWSPERLAHEDFIAAFRDAVGTVRNHPATYGYYLVDEPSPTPENSRNIEIAKRSIEAIDPAHPGFSCLLGDYPPLYRQVGYHVLLVDIYPVSGSNRLQGGALDGYIAAVDRARETAAGKPMWVIPQAFGFGQPKPHSIPAPNEISLMVWEAIAHGAKGIMYFIYQSTTGIQGEWLQGIVDMKLQPMDHRYEEVRRTNAAVRAVADTMLKLTWRKNDITAAEPGLDVQAFVDAAGTPYLCVVNQDTGREVTANLRLSPAWAGKVNAADEVATKASVWTNDALSVRLGPGEGKVLRLRVR